MLTAQSGGGKLAHTLMYALAAVLLLALLGLNSLSIMLFGINGTVTESKKVGKYTYITITEDYGQTMTYRTNNPFVMQNVNSLWLDTDAEEYQEITDNFSEKEDDETEADEITDNSEESTDTSQGETSGQTQQQDGLTIQNMMLAVYNYLQDQHALQNMAFSYTANAKGEVYAIVSEGQEEKDGSTVNVRYCLYDNGAKTDENGKSCEELVLEKVYPDGNYETELVDFYLVDTESMQVTDEQKITW